MADLDTHRESPGHAPARRAPAVPGATAVLDVRRETSRERFKHGGSRRLERAIRLTCLLQSHGGSADLRTLLNALSVCRRTFHRDLDFLRTAGVVIQYSKGDYQYHLLDPGWGLAEALTLRECAALVLFLGGRCDRPPSPGYEEALAEAKTKATAAIFRGCRAFQPEFEEAMAVFSGRKVRDGPPTIGTGAKANLTSARL